MTEDNLWEAKYLGSTNPYTLLETLIYLNTKNFLLPDVESHLGLSFSNVMKQWKKNVVSSDGKPARTVYLKYNPYSTIQAGKLSLVLVLGTLSCLYLFSFVFLFCIYFVKSKSSEHLASSKHVNN